MDRPADVGRILFAPTSEFLTVQVRLLSAWCWAAAASLRLPDVLPSTVPADLQGIVREPSHFASTKEICQYQYLFMMGDKRPFFPSRKSESIVM